MSYGVLIRGNAGQIIIDDSNPCIHLAASGSYGHTTGRETVIRYPHSIQSQYEPYVFVRPNGPHQIYLFRHIGSPGNWTGFGFWQATFQDADPPVYGGQWKAGAVMLPKTDGWGMHVFDLHSRVMFDSNRDIVRFVGGAQKWSRYAFNPNYPGGMKLQTWSLPFTYEGGVFFQVSHFSINAFFTLEAPRVGFLYNSRSMIFASAIVSDETSIDFNWPLIVVE